MKQRFLMPSGCYLLSHSVGCLPAETERLLSERYFRPWRELGGNVWPPWLAEVERFRARVAQLIGARTDAVCPQVNVSGAVSKILHSLTGLERRDRLLLCEEDFPSLGFVLGAASRVGLKPVFLPRGEASEDPDVWRTALDDRTRLALVTHCFSNRSARLPVSEITALARQRGVVTVVDATQSLGVIPIDVSEWAADFVVGSSVKFLCGGPGAAFLWVADSALNLSSPLDTGWFSHADPYEFDIHDFQPAPDARRFWGGTPSVVPFVQAAIALELLLGIGIGAIHTHNQGLISQLHASVPRAVVRSSVSPDCRGNVVLLQVRSDARALAALHEAGIFADARAGCIRVSPHLYNDSSDVASLLTALHGHL